MSQEKPNNKEQDKKSIQIDIDEETSEGKYCNITLSNYSKEEFILDFAFLQPQVAKGKIKSRIILSPRNTKRLAQMLVTNIKDYEKKMGLIDDDRKNAGSGFNVSVN